MSEAQLTCAPCDDESPKRPRRPYHIVTLSITDSPRLGLVLTLDIPPCLSPCAPLGDWPPQDVVAHAEWEVRQLRASPTPGLLDIRVVGPPAMWVDDEGDIEMLAADSAPLPLVIRLKALGKGLSRGAPRSL